MGELKVAQPTVSILTILHVYLDLAPPCQKKSEISQPPLPPRQKKSRIRETKHLSTDADSSTDTTVGWTKNTQKPNFFEKRKKSFKSQKLKNV